jgi:hypothetical protein
MHILQQDPIDCKICILIDGLEEFQGTYTDIDALCSLIRELAESTKVKLIVSSRPLIPFEDRFKHYKSLVVHDITWRDIRTIVEQKLGSHPRLLALLAQNRQPLSEIVDDIVRKSSGVFLWVHLAINAMLEGLQNDDGLDQLLQTLSKVPAELEHIISYLLAKVPKRYRCEAYQLHRIAHSWYRETGFPISAYVMWYAIQSRDQYETAAPDPQVAAFPGNQSSQRTLEAQATSSPFCRTVFVPSPSPRARN